MCLSRNQFPQLIITLVTSNLQVQPKDKYEFVNCWQLLETIDANTGLLKLLGFVSMSGPEERLIYSRAYIWARHFHVYGWFIH